MDEIKAMLANTDAMAVPGMPTADEFARRTALFDAIDIRVADDTPATGFPSAMHFVKTMMLPNAFSRLATCGWWCRSPKNTEIVDYHFWT